MYTHDITGNKQPTAYHAVASSPEMSLQFFETELTRPEFVEGVNRGKWIPFFVPSLVHQILEKSVTSVCPQCISRQH